MKSILIILAIFLTDLILGDPEYMPHPVKLFGRIIEDADEWVRTRKGGTDEKGE